MTDFVLDDCWNRIGVRGDRSCARLDDVLHCRNCPVHADAARLIMKRPMPTDYAQTWAAEFAEPLAIDRGAGVSGLVFRIGREWLALPTAWCMRVADLAPVHHLPHRSNTVLEGVVNVDGKLTAQLSLAAMLTIDARQTMVVNGRHVYPRLLVLRLDSLAVAIPVQELHGITHYHADDLQAPPATVNKAMARYLTGVLSVGALQVGCLDAELLIYNMAEALR